MDAIDKAVELGLIEIYYVTKPADTAYTVYRCRNDKCDADHRHPRKQMVRHVTGILKEVS